MYKTPIRLNKSQLILRRDYLIQDNKRRNDEVYYHMDLQAKGVKYKPRSTDKTYHGRKAIHQLMVIDFQNRQIEELDRKIASL